MARAGRAQRLGAYIWRGATTFLTFLGESDLTGVATTTADAQYVAGGDASFQGVGTVTAEASKVSGPAEPLELDGVATLNAEGSLQLLGEATLQAVATISADGGEVTQHAAEATLIGVATIQADVSVGHAAEALLQGVTTVSAEAGEAVHEGEATLQGVAHMGFDPLHTPRRTPWYRRGKDGRLRPGTHPRDAKTGPAGLRARSQDIYR
jgi:hypothetical protein